MLLSFMIMVNRVMSNMTRVRLIRHFSLLNLIHFFRYQSDMTGFFCIILV